MCPSSPAHGDAHALRRRVRIPTDVPAEAIGLGSSGGVAGAAAEDVLAGNAGVPLVGPAVPRPRSELRLVELRVGPGLAAVDGSTGTVTLIVSALRSDNLLLSDIRNDGVVTDVVVLTADYVQPIARPSALLISARHVDQ